MNSKRTHLFYYNKLLILTALLLFGYLSRVLHLGDQSLWGDEAFTYMVIKAEDWLATLSRDVHPPLYFALITAWSRIAGVSEFSLRYPAVLASMINLSLMALVAREVLWHHPAARRAVVPVLAVLLLALADLEIQVAQEARSYTLHLVWVLLSLLSYLKWIRSGKRQWAVGFTLSSALIVYTHYIGVFTPVAIGVHALLFLRGRQRIEAIAMLVLAAGLFMPWLLAVVLPQQVGKFASDVVQAAPSNWETLWAFRVTWFTQQWPLLLGLALLGSVGLHYTAHRWQVRWRPLRGSGLLLVCIVVPLALAFWSNLYLPTLFDYRISQITPAIVVLIALGIANLRGFARGFVVVVIVVYGVTMVDSYRPKPPWREFGALIAAYAQPDDLLLSQFTGGDYTVEYYRDRLLPDVAMASMWQWRTFEPETYESGLLGTIDSYDHIWLARWSDDDEAFAKLGATGHVVTDRRVVQHLDNEFELYRFDRLPETPIDEFENGMVLVDAVVDVEQLRVDLWWEATEALEADYIVSVKWFGAAGQLIAQHDAPLQPGTSQWAVGTVDFDPHVLMPVGDDSALPEQMTIEVYQWVAETIVPVLSKSTNDVVKITID